jgi:anti-sigma-K factor RskA
MSSCRQTKALFAGRNPASSIACTSTLHIARETQQQAMSAGKIRLRLEKHLWKAVWTFAYRRRVEAWDCAGGWRHVQAAETRSRHPVTSR